MRTEDLLNRLDDIESRLEALPDVRLSSHSKARLRAHVMAHARGGRPAVGPSGWWQQVLAGAAALFTPRALARPVAAGVSVLAAVALAGGTTVSAAMDSLPGDGLYPVKTAYEQSCLMLARSDDALADCHLKVASTRIDDLARATDTGRLDAVPKIAKEYGVNVGQALSLAANSKQPEKVERQKAALQSSFQQVVEKAPSQVRDMVGIALSVTVTTTPGGATIIDTTPPVANQPQPPASSAAAYQEDVPVDPSTVTGQPPPGGGSVPTGKGQPVADPGPSKQGPLSNPPVAPVSSDPLPAKNDIGPATAPLPTKQDSGTALPEPEKNESPAAAPAPAPAVTPSKTETPPATTDPVPQSPTAGKEPAVPAGQAPTPEQKPAVVQSAGGTLPIPGNKY